MSMIQSRVYPNGLLTDFEKNRKVRFQRVYIMMKYHIEMEFEKERLKYEYHD